MSILNDYFEEELFDEAERSADEYLHDQPFDFNKEIIGKIDSDVDRLGHGATTNEVVKQRYKLLQRLDGIPAYHGIAREYWLEYRDQVLHRVNALYPNRRLASANLPTW